MDKVNRPAAPKPSALNQVSSIDYGALQNEDEHNRLKASHPRRKLLLVVAATLFAVATLVILVVYFTLHGRRDGIHVSNVGSEVAQSSLNMTDMERVVAVLSRVPLIDGHTDFFDLLRARTQNKLGTVNFSRDVTEQWGFSQIDIPRMRQGMMGAQFWAAFLGSSPQDKDAIRVSLEQIDLIKRFMAQYVEAFTLVTTVQGIWDTFEGGKIACLIGLEGGHSIDNSLATLRMFYDLGVRYMTLAHLQNNDWAESTGDGSVPSLSPSNSGLTEFGMNVVKEMNRLGMIIDLSHTAHATIIDTLNVTTAPVIFSHSAAWELCNHHLNYKDEILQMVASNDGIVMVIFLTASLDCNGGDLGAVNVTSVADHIEYIRDVAGLDHVGIGAAYDSPVYYDADNRWIGDLNTTNPEGIEDVSRYPAVFAELASRGWTDDDLEKLAGRNFLRVFSAVEQESDRLSSLVKPSEELIPQADISDFTCRSDL